MRPSRKHSTAFLSKLEKLEEEIKTQDLPQDWDLFAEQAQLYYVLKELEQYLKVKKSLKVAYN